MSSIITINKQQTKEPANNEQTNQTKPKKTNPNKRKYISQLCSHWPATRRGRILSRPYTEKYIFHFDLTTWRLLAVWFESCDQPVWLPRPDGARAGRLGPRAAPDEHGPTRTAVGRLPLPGRGVRAPLRAIARWGWENGRGSFLSAALVPAGS